MGDAFVDDLTVWTCHPFVADRAVTVGAPAEPGEPVEASAAGGFGFAVVAVAAVVVGGDPPVGPHAGRRRASIE